MSRPQTQSTLVGTQHSPSVPSAKSSPTSPTNLSSIPSDTHADCLAPEVSPQTFDGSASFHVSIPGNYDDSNESKEANPWKHIGYRVFSRLVASDQTFFVLRKFGTLNARVALALQDGIVELEEELNELDNYNRCSDVPEDRNNASLRSDLDPRRNQIIQEILPNKLAQYNAFVNGYAQLVDRTPVKAQDVDTMRTWFNKHPGAIDSSESAYICRNSCSDLIAVQPKNRSWFRTLLESTFASQLSIFQREPFQCHCETGVDDDTASIDLENGEASSSFSSACDYHIIKEYKDVQQDIVWQHDKRLETFSTTVIAFVGLGMLVGPIWWLDHVSVVEKRLGIITGFITLFFVLLKVATNAHVFESLAATAAYGAVLMVFIQMGNV